MYYSILIKNIKISKMAGKKLLNCFVRFKNDCGYYKHFKVIRQEGNLCTLTPLFNQNLPKIRKRVDELEKIRVVTVCLKSEEIEKINSDLKTNSICKFRHGFTKMFEKAWKLEPGLTILHIINHKYPHLFYSSGFFVKHLDKNEKLYYTTDIYALIYQCKKNKHE